MKRLVGTVLLGLALAACGGEDTAATNATSSASASGSGGSGGSSTSSGSSGTGGAGGSAGPCTAGNICFDVKPYLTGAVAPGRTAVMWYQFNDDGPDPTPLIAYDQPFDPAVTRVTIAVSDIGIPGEDLLVCERACNDETMCPCLSDPKIGFGIVMVADDADQSGSITPTEAFGYYGLGWMVLGYSAQPYMVPPPPFDVTFPEGIVQGIHPYRVIAVSGGFHDLGLSQDGDVFDLNLCPGPGTACMPAVPNVN